VSAGGESEHKQPEGTRRSWTDLGPRLASAFVLVPLTAISLYFGSYLLAAVVGAVFAGAYREWERMVNLKPVTPFGMTLIGLVGLAALVFPLWGPLATLALTLLGAIGSLVRGGPAAFWRAGGLVYFGLVIVAVLMVRGTETIGLYACLVLGTTVWLTDTGAFFTGRQVGGEKLAPDISPSKTWSGALGGLALGTAAGTVLWQVLVPGPWWIALGLCAATSVLGQAGDLAESALKRRFRIKDSGDIIPGHGGLMDRLDSITFGALFLYLVGALHMGPDAVAAGFLNWS
jgi:phosphatidate cytidylyltransferase